MPSKQALEDEEKLIGTFKVKYKAMVVEQMIKLKLLPPRCHFTS